MENPIYKFKEEQKKLADRIRSDEGTDYDSYTYRHNHIAYCELRGTPRDQIELPAEGNEPVEYLIDRAKDLWTNLIQAWRDEREKTLCDND